MFGPPERHADYLTRYARVTNVIGGSWDRPPPPFDRGGWKWIPKTDKTRPKRQKRQKRKSNRWLRHGACALSRRPFPRSSRSVFTMGKTRHIPPGTWASTSSTPGQFPSRTPIDELRLHPLVSTDKPKKQKSGWWTCISTWVLTPYIRSHPGPTNPRPS